MGRDTLKRLLVWSIIGIGISSVTTQLLTIREFLTQFQGNEITISLVVFCWLLTQALGSLSARFIRSSSLKIYVPLLFVAGIWPLLQIVVNQGIEGCFFYSRGLAGFLSLLFYILVIVAPYCLLTGFILPCAQRPLTATAILLPVGISMWPTALGISPEALCSALSLSIFLNLSPLLQ